MSKFLDRLEEINLGAPAPMGFGAPRTQKTPGMALVGLISGTDSKLRDVLSDLVPDATLISGIDDSAALKELSQSLSGDIPWGTRVSSLTEEDARAIEELGCDMLAFPLQGTPLAAVASEEMARVLCIPQDMDLDQLRAIGALPVDVLLLSVPSTSSLWTLQDLAAIAAVGRRVDKYILVEVSAPPGAKELEVIRDAGVHGLVVDVGAVDSEKLSELKAALMDMPRRRSRNRDRAAALIPSSVFFPSPAPEPQDPEPEEDE